MAATSLVALRRSRRSRSIASPLSVCWAMAGKASTVQHTAGGSPVVIDSEDTDDRHIGDAVFQRGRHSHRYDAEREDETYDYADQGDGSDSDEEDFAMSSSSSYASKKRHGKARTRRPAVKWEDLTPEEIIFGKRVPFAEIGIKDPALLEALHSLGYICSTKVQAASIPMVLSEDRRAVIINSETGSGKTLLYLAPALELILRLPPRPQGAKHPMVLIMVPGLELAVQVAMVAQQIADAIPAHHRKVSVYNARRGWPETVPDILVCTPRAAAQGLEPCTSTDEIARKEALRRIKDTELVVFDEADLLLDQNSLAPDVRTVLTGIAASLPDQPRLIQSEAQVYYPEGIPVRVLDQVGLEWENGRAWHNPDGTFKVELESGVRIKRIRRNYMDGPGVGLLVEHGPRFVATCATLPTYTKARYLAGKKAGEMMHKLYRSGIGTSDWVLKRLYPHAVRIQSRWVHRLHPCIKEEEWVFIPGEKRREGARKLEIRIQKCLDILRKQGPEVRTLIFANSPDSCNTFALAAKRAKIKLASVYAGVSMTERLEALKGFGIGEVPVLICTDIASRGLDLPICDHVIQLEFALTVVTHLHRMGRATRAAKQCKVTNLWGDGDAPLRDVIMQVPFMGLDGALLTDKGFRGRLYRSRAKQRRNEAAYTEVRRTAKLARRRTQNPGDNQLARRRAQPSAE
eukprot:TRINITY_DN773_c0_g1_i1.p1 TRINITY_DN773_c0_g1~~TRINITY_DN773_c0_g1_i1.p1  ORF type:complete len:754 (-),score=122.79 TRINITY_DN773_c0_g1_i1:43-2103(-)